MAPGAQCRVMVVDDSAVIRGLLRRLLESDGSITVVASVPNGEAALRTLSRHEIDIVILDIDMPVMDGLTALPRMIELKPEIRVIMASTLTRENAEISLRALQAGASDYVTKPSSTSELHSAGSFQRELTEKVKALHSARQNPYAGGARVAPAGGRTGRPTTPGKLPEAFKLRNAPVLPPEVIAIASSTGGPPALLELFANLAGDVKQPILITQHMPATFTMLLAEHIDRISDMPSREGRDGEPLTGGTIYVAPGGYHMEAVRDGDRNVIRLTQEPPENFCRPSADPMFRTLSRIYGPRVLAVVLTGMGSDGRLGAEAITEAGGTVVAQDAETSVVWGMPGAVAKAGLCTAVLPLAEIAPYIRKTVMRPAA